MEKIIKIMDIKNEVEARAIEQLLKDNNIPFHLRSLSDTAYNGIYQLQKGWGYIEAPEDYKNEIIEIYENFKKK